jgi:hypothetical protein
MEYQIISGIKQYLRYCHIQNLVKFVLVLGFNLKYLNAVLKYVLSWFYNCVKNPLELVVFDHSWT